MAGGSGTASDPYKASTWDELVNYSKLVAGAVYIEVANDITITDEYPSGNAPMLRIYGTKYIDGKGFTINNCYFTTHPMVYVDATGTDYGSSDRMYIKNLNFGNIYYTYASGSDQSRACILSAYTAGYLFQNCKFWGAIISDRSFVVSPSTDGTAYPIFYGCSICVKSSAPGSYIVSSRKSMFAHNTKFENCAIKWEYSPGLNNSFFREAYYNNFLNCYIEVNNVDEGTSNMRITMPTSNCVVDLHTNLSSSFFVWGNSPKNILRKSSAPNLSAGSNVAIIPEEHWLDVPYLQSVGFNIV